MQMCTIKACSNTWGYYAVDGDGDGIKSVYDPADAIYAAAAMVRVQYDPLPGDYDLHAAGPSAENPGRMNGGMAADSARSAIATVLVITG